MNLDKIIKKARSSSFYLKMLNYGLNHTIPFNKPHGIKVIEIDDHHIKTFIPYKKRNFNHIRGVHACALATLSEFTTGFLLISRLDSKKYRIIMKALYMDYFWQAKKHVYASFEISDQWLEENVYKPLESEEAVLVKCTVETRDEDDNLLATGNIHWHIKPWEKVRTKV
jgi:acyl-coenzyme A thioesterase PaaI-like protein